MSAEGGKISLDEVQIRTDLQARDVTRVIQLHGSLYQQEFGYGFVFESYVSAGMYEFLRHYDPQRSCFWLCEHDQALVGCLGLMDRGDSAQLRFFLVHPRFRGLGLGHRLLDAFIERMHSRGFSSAYLWTTHDLAAAAHLYQAYGFQLLEERASSRFAKPVVEQKYALELGST